MNKEDLKGLSPNALLSINFQFLGNLGIYAKFKTSKNNKNIEIKSKISSQKFKIK